jgi:hypothetical protein
MLIERTFYCQENFYEEQRESQAGQKEVKVVRVVRSNMLYIDSQLYYIYPVHYSCMALLSEIRRVKQLDSNEWVVGVVKCR